MNFLKLFLKMNKDSRFYFSSACAYNLEFLIGPPSKEIFNKDNKVGD